VHAAVLRDNISPPVAAWGAAVVVEEVAFVVVVFQQVVVQLEKIRKVLRHQRLTLFYSE
jgi:hypothetical protein